MWFASSRADVISSSEARSVFFLLFGPDFRPRENPKKMWGVFPQKNRVKTHDWRSPDCRF
jgi:hypothetical protein